ncbi:MAG: winged helix-turn-helix transcriptional regulator [Clostridium sp.]|nr:winged helix-turn-helix transcriptional regulator [Clostridium sp.]
MDKYYIDLNVIDLISEKHAKLRKKVRKSWNEQGGDNIGDTESYVLALLERKNMTISEISRQIEISRQGTHKCCHSLMDRGYIMVIDSEINSRDKVLRLTDKGLEFCKESLKLKEKLEIEIKESIGEENFKIIKECFGKVWLKN